MSNAKPYLTTDTLVESIKRRIMMPISQNSLQYSDLVAFLNEEMQMSAVPSVKMEHEEYFVYKQTIELVNGVSRYEIPNRSIGMTLRDLKYSDASGNFYDMTRIAPEDKAFFQQSNGSNQTVSKYYLEGNEIVLTPSVQAGASGTLIAWIFLRPNSLVRNDRAAIIQHYKKDITISTNGNFEVGDEFVINTANNTSAPLETLFTAINSNVQTLVSIDINGVITTTATHGFNVDAYTTINLTGITGVSPSLNGGSYSVRALSSTTFQLIEPTILVAGTGGSYSIPNQFVIGGSATTTAINLSSAINTATISGVTTQIVTAGTINITYTDISNTFEDFKAQGAVNPSAFTIDNVHTYISFNSLNSTYTDPETMQSSDLYTNGCTVDFLQTNPGHRTYTYDIPLTYVSSVVAKFPSSLLKTYATNSNGGTLTYLNIKIGDYICLSNECIIPQLPPEVHSALAERAASRVLMAIGDMQGYQVSQAKLAEMNKMQETLIGSRVEGSVMKVFNRYSLLRLGKSRFRRS